MSLQDITAKITSTLEDEGVIKASIFGSYATGNEREDSDIDILVEFDGRRSIFDLVGLKLNLEKQLDKKVDIMTFKSIHPLLKDIILQEQKTVYEKRS